MISTKNFPELAINVINPANEERRGHAAIYRLGQDGVTREVTEFWYDSDEQFRRVMEAPRTEFNIVRGKTPTLAPRWASDAICIRDAVGVGEAMEYVRDEEFLAYCLSLPWGKYPCVAEVAGHRLCNIRERGKGEFSDFFFNFSLVPPPADPSADVVFSQVRSGLSTWLRVYSSLPREEALDKLEVHFEGVDFGGGNSIDRLLELHRKWPKPVKNGLPRGWEERPDIRSHAEELSSKIRPAQILG